MSNRKTSKWDQSPTDSSYSTRKKKISKNVEPDKSVQFKTELHLLSISEDARNMILEALKFINGEEFSTKDLSAYRDRGVNLNSRYWIDKGNLVIKSVENYSLKKKKQEPLLAHEKLKKFAMDKLEKYGFHTTHCNEALDLTSGDVGAAYELLMQKYFNIASYDAEDCDINSNANDNKFTPEDVITERKQELESLTSIYDDMCEERLANQLWVIHLKLPYLVEYYFNLKRTKNYFNSNKRNCDNKDENLYNSRGNFSYADSRQSSNSSNKSSEVCRFFLKGNCKFGNKCRHLHTNNLVGKHYSTSEAKVDAKQESEDLSKCDIEIRFPSGCRYPFRDSALVSFYSVKSVLPSEVCLRISRHLLQMMQKSIAQEDIGCVYSLVDFMSSEEEVLSVATSNEHIFIDAMTPLVGDVDNVEDEGENNGPRDPHDPSLYSRADEPESNIDKYDIDEATLSKINDELSRRYRRKQNDHVYSRYLTSRKGLPAWSKKSSFLETVSKNQVVIISGETGCGKSTQVPQFILDDWLDSRENGNVKNISIMCTQPRRLSTLGVASRVAEERTEKLGNVVGYQIRLDSRMSANTRLLFCTTGVLLRKLENDPHLRNVTHIIVDEVHERSDDSDFLLMILKQLLPLRPDLKLILMSATMNAELFSDYFKGAPLIDIPGRTFPVEDLFLEDIMDAVNYVLEENSEFCKHNLPNKHGKNSFFDADEELRTELETSDVRFSAMKVGDKIKDEHLTLNQICCRYKGYSKQTCKNLYMMDHEKINYELIESILMWLTLGEHDFPTTGSILVFLPGIQEILALLNRLKQSSHFNSRKFLLVPLHSTLTNEEQSLVFKNLPQSVRKIVLSTNIAETSITIDDCVFVVDAGKMKEKRFDSNKNMESLDTVWVSRANALQRKGRAGRVMPGVCIHLYTSNRMEFNMAPRPVPEIHRVPLEQLIIRVKILPLFIDRTVQNVFDDLIEPPTADSVTGSMKRLQSVGALDKNDCLTSLGQHLGALPVDVRIGKLILYGAIFCCLDSALTIAACLSYKSPFLSSFKNKEGADAKKKEFATNKSDQLMILRAYNAWREKRAINTSASHTFANENFMSHHTLTMLVDIKHQFLQLLAGIGFVDSSSLSNLNKGIGVDRTLELTGQELNTNSNNNKLLISILCAALYPNIVKILTPEKNYSVSACGAVTRVPNVEEVKFKTKSDGYVHLHPSSVNYNVCDFSSPYLVYQEKVRTSRVFIRDCSMVPVMPLVLFSGSVLEVQLNNGVFVVSLEDGWIMFSTQSNEIAELLQALQIELFKVLEEKTQDPKLNLLTYPKGKKIITTIIYLVTHG